MAPPLSPSVRTVRRRTRRRVACLRLLATALAVGFALELLVALLASPRFAVTRIEVLGARSVPNALIISRAAIPDGANVFRLHRRQAARRVAALPAIRSASLRRRPPHTIAIEVVERRPVVFVQGAGGKIYVDRDAVCFQLSNEDTPAVELLGISARHCQPGQRVRDRRIAPVLRVCAQAQNERLLPARIAVGITGQIDLLLASGATLRLGEADRLAEKLHKARLALDAFSDRGPIEYLDLSCPDVVVWKPAPPHPEPEAREPEQGASAAL